MKKKRFMKFIVWFVIVANCLFSIGVLWVFYKVQAEPITLIGFWFAFTTTELLSMADIKKKENKSEDMGDK